MSYKWILGGVILAVLFAVTSVWWYQYEMAIERETTANFEKLLEEHNKQKGTPSEAVPRSDSNDGELILEPDKKTSEQEISKEELAFWEQLGVTPPPDGHTYAKLGGTFQLRKKNTMHVTVTLESTPEFSSLWLPDDAYRHYYALIGLCSGEDLIGVGRLTPAETARAKEMLKVFKDIWAPHTNISLGVSGVYTPEHDHKAESDMRRAYKKRERELQDKLGITPHRVAEDGGWSFDVDIMRTLLAQIRKDISK